ncbi:MAG: hypothetical protein KAR42_06690 [candidate division Zixibacteria bacterium]|nr:hypothetical protein [candidate division Zixibacteria bacterium]
MKYFFVPIVVFFSLIIAACGPYSFSASGKAAFKSLHIKPFDNKTIEYELTDKLFDALTTSFQLDNTVQILEVSKAEAVMSGTLTGYRRDPYDYNEQDVVEQYAVKVTFLVRIVKANSEDVILEESFYAEGIYDANTEAETQEGHEKVIIKLTADILDKITKSW